MKYPSHRNQTRQLVGRIDGHREARSGLERTLLFPAASQVTSRLQADASMSSGFYLMSAHAGHETSFPKFSDSESLCSCFKFRISFQILTPRSTIAKIAGAAALVWPVRV